MGSDVARDGVIFLVVGFLMYLAWKNELGLYISFATTSAPAGAGTSMAVAANGTGAAGTVATGGNTSTSSGWLGVYDSAGVQIGVVQQGYTNLITPGDTVGPNLGLGASDR